MTATTLKENPQASHPEVANILALFTAISGRTGTDAPSANLQAEITAAETLLAELGDDASGTTGAHLARILKELSDVEKHTDLKAADKTALKRLVAPFRKRYEGRETMSTMRRIALTTGALLGLAAAGYGIKHEIDSEGIRGRDMEGKDGVSLLASLTAGTDIATQDTSVSFEYLWTELRKNAMNIENQIKAEDEIDIAEKNEKDDFTITTNVDLKTRIITFKAISGKTGAISTHTLKQTGNGDIMINQDASHFVVVTPKQLDRLVRGYAKF